MVASSTKTSKIESSACVSYASRVGGVVGSVALRAMKAVSNVGVCEGAIERTVAILNITYKKSSGALVQYGDCRRCGVDDIHVTIIVFQLLAVRNARTSVEWVLARDDARGDIAEHERVVDPRVRPAPHSESSQTTKSFFAALKRKICRFVRRRGNAVDEHVVIKPKLVTLRRG